jgi:hypothetical protein
MVLILGAGVALAAQGAQHRAAGPGRIAGPIDEARAVTLGGNVHPLARAEFDQGPVAAEAGLGRMVLELEPSASQQAELDALVAAQHDPHSPLYQKWLTPGEYGSRFGASAADVARVARWLEGHGFRVEEIPASNRLIVFSGTAGEVAETFHTEIHRYRVGGATHLSNALDPQIPEALSGVVGGVVSLHDFRRVAAMTARRPLATQASSEVHAGMGTLPQFTTGGQHYLFPADFAAIYDLNSLYSAGTTGTGTSIAIVGRSNIHLSDVAAFRAATGLGANAPAVILAGADPGLVSGDQDESTLDVEWAGAVAPAAQVQFVVGDSAATTDGVDLSAEYIVNHALAPVVSTSYGSCEQEMGATELAFYNSLWEQAASQGMSAFVASGDAGAAGCNSGSDTAGSGTGVNGLCSSPYATCVGGTEFNEGQNPAEYWSASNSPSEASALGYIPEEVWNESGSTGGFGLWASGGGASVVYPQPAWQKGLSGAGAANGMRAVPDVALSAAAHDGYIIYENGSYWIISGTSAASPSLAGMMALVVESQGGRGQGNANEGLYPLANAAQNPFHATASGNNSVPGVAGFTASGATYNLATGLGSVDGALLVKSWGSGAGQGADFALTVSATGGTAQVGKTTTFTVGVAESGAGKSTVTLTAKAPAGVTAAVQPSSIAPGTLATVTVTAGAAAGMGTANVAITGSDASGSQTVNYALTVTVPPPALTLTPAAAALSVAQGSTVAEGLNVAGNSSYSGPVTLSVSGLPAGVTASWSSDPLALTGGAGATTLTLLASGTAPVGMATIVVTASGDGVMTSRQIALAVLQGPGVQLVVSPAAVTMQPAGTATVVATAIPVGGMTVASRAAGSSIGLTAGVPKGLTATWSAPSVSPGGSVFWTLTLTGSANAGAGLYPLGVTASVASKSGAIYAASQTVALTVTPPPPVLALAAGSASVPLMQGAAASVAVTVSSNAPFNGPVTLSANGLPAGVTASWSSDPVTMSGQSAVTTLTLLAQKTAVVGPATFMITASAGGAAASRQITMQVGQAPGVQLGLGATALSMPHAGTGALGVSVIAQGGLSGPVTLSLSGLPAGVTASFSKASLSGVGTASATLTFTGSAAAKAGTSSLTVTAAVSGANGKSYSASQGLTLTLR